MYFLIISAVLVWKSNLTLRLNKCRRWIPILKQVKILSKISVIYDSNFLSLERHVYAYHYPKIGSTHSYDDTSRGIWWGSVFIDIVVQIGLNIFCIFLYCTLGVWFKSQWKIELLENSYTPVDGHVSSIFSVSKISKSKVCLFYTLCHIRANLR